MKSKTSFFSKAVFKQNIRSYWPVWAGIWIYCLVTGPLVVWKGLRSQSLYRNLTSADISQSELQSLKSAVVVNALADCQLALAAAVLALVVALSLFSYLFSARSANMFHAYPVSRRSLFLTNYASGFVFLSLPQAVSLLIAWVVAVSSGVNLWKAFALWFLIALGEEFFFFNMAVCVVMSVGHILVAPVLYGILNYLYLGAVVVANAVVCNVCYGLSRGLGLIDPFASPLTPMLYLYRHVHVAVAADPGGQLWGIRLYGGRILLGYVLAGLAFGAAAWLTYRRRHLETVGDVISVSWLRPVFRWGIALCAGVLCALWIVLWLFEYHSYSYRKQLAVFVIISFLVATAGFFATQMLMKKTFLVFQKRLLLEWAAMLLFIGGVYLALGNDLFDIIRRVPEAADVKAALLTLDGGVYVDQTEDIAKVCGIHQSVLDYRKEVDKDMEKNGGYGRALDVIYLLEDGSELSRRYILPGDLEDETSPDGPLHQLQALNLSPECVLKGAFGPNYDVLEGEEGMLEATGNDDTYIQIELTAQQTQIVYEAMLKDAEESVDGPAEGEPGAWAVAEDDLYHSWIVLTLSDPRGLIDDRIENWYAGRGRISYGDGNVTCNYALSARDDHTISALLELGLIESADALIN